MHSRLGRRSLIVIVSTGLAAAAVFIAVSGFSGARAQSGSHLDFKGPGGGYLSVPDDAALTPTNAISIEAWVYLTSASAHGGVTPTFVGKNLVTSYWFGMSIGKLQFSMEYHVDSFAISSGSVPLNQWTHIAVTYDKSHVKFYINGVLDSSIALSYPIGKNSGPLYIGSDPGDAGSPKGFLDDVRIWSDARTAPEVLADTGCVDPASSGLVADWTFNDGTTDLAGSRAGTLNGDVQLDDSAAPSGVESCGSTATPTTSPQPGLRGDANCDNTVNIDDLIPTLRSAAGLQPGAACPALADVNCNNGVDSDDALRIMRFVLNIPLPQPSSCQSTGSPVQLN